MIAVLLVLSLVGSPCLTPPVDVAIAVPYREPACRYCPGHRGIEYQPMAGTPVRAVAAGRVTFAGSVSGTLYVVVQQVDGMLATYGMLQSAAVRMSADVEAGQLVGFTTDRLYFGWRRHGEAIDPTPFLAQRRRWARLLPTDGSRPRPGGSNLVCRK